MSRFSTYGQRDSRIIEELDSGFVGFNNRLSSDQLKSGMLVDSQNGRMDLDGSWQVRKGIDNVSSVVVLNTSGITLPFTLNDSSAPTIVDTAQPNIWASCAFSDPSQENSQYIVIATNDKASATDVSSGTATTINYPPSYVLGSNSFLLQAFNKVILFTDGVTALEWDGSFSDVDAGDFIIGLTYTITTVGSTDFTAIGAASNAVGVVFTATGVGSGNGKAVSGFTKVESGSYTQPVLLTSTNSTVVSNGLVTVTLSNTLSVGDKVVVVDKGGTELVNGDIYEIATASSSAFAFYAPISDGTGLALKVIKEVSVGGGYSHMPAPSFGTYHNGRLAVPYNYTVNASDNSFTARDASDEILISNGFDTDTYDTAFNQFTLNAGKADFVVGMKSFSEDKLIVFNRNSIYAITGTTNLSNSAQSLITEEIGCVARDSIVQVGDVIMFLSDNGVYGANFQDLYNLRGNDVPLSEAIDATIQGINKDNASKAVAVYFDNKYYIAVPVGVNATKNNTILIFNFLNKQWESIDTCDNANWDIENLIVSGEGSNRSLYAVNSLGGVHKVDSRTDGNDVLSVGDYQTLGSVNAGSFVTGEYYQIEAAGNTNFTLVGAANSVVGTVFIATGAGSGTGTAQLLSTITTVPYSGDITTRQYIAGTIDRKKWNNYEMFIESSEENIADFDVTAITENFDTTTNLGSISTLTGSTLAANSELSLRGRIGNKRGYGFQFKINNTTGRPKIKTIKVAGTQQYNT